MERIPPKQMAEKISKLLKKERPDPNYLKKVFEHIRRELDLKGKIPKKNKLPELLTNDELAGFYDAVWNAANRTHMVMIKLLLFTGIRNSELANLKMNDIDLVNLKCRIHGKGIKDRYVPIPASFRGELPNIYLSKTKRERNICLKQIANRNSQPDGSEKSLKSMHAKPVL